MLRRIVNSQWFALTDLTFVMLSGAIRLINPESGFWVILIALLPWGVRVLAGRFPFQRTPLDWPLALFLITAWVGYWAAYDQTAAWNKVWFIVLAVLLYYALSAQPRENLGWVGFFAFLIGLGVSIYFSLTSAIQSSSGLALWWRSVRPPVEWPALHPGYISGVLSITTLVAIYGISKIRINSPGPQLPLLRLVFISGLGFMLWTLIVTMSRGLWLAMAAAVGAWLMRQIISRVIPQLRPFYPFLVILLLGGFLTFVLMFPGGPEYAATGESYGQSTRSELFSRGLQILTDVPVLGGGLSSFAGLYSQYYLVIPSVFYDNTYNMFLDVAIEQGLIGGLAFLFIYLGSVWSISRAIGRSPSKEIRNLRWLALFVLMIAGVHGLIYDYLYNGAGVFLLFFPMGFAMIGLLQATGQDENGRPHPAARAAKPASGLWVLAAVIPVLILLFAFNIDQIRARYAANLGVVQMAQAELADFPTGQWTEPAILPSFAAAEDSFRFALQLDPLNRTANHHLGLIAMLRGDFESACASLQTALAQTPNHRGIIKSLGYCYVWLGELDPAVSLLAQIPEADHELGVYVWWWAGHGRDDLSAQAALMLSKLQAAVE